MTRMRSSNENRFSVNYDGDEECNEARGQGQDGVLRASVSRLGNGYSRLVKLHCGLMLPMSIVGHALIISKVLLF